MSLSPRPESAISTRLPGLSRAQRFAPARACELSSAGRMPSTAQSSSKAASASSSRAETYSTRPARLRRRVAAGAAVSWLLQSADHWRLPLKLVWYVPAALLLFSAALFPIMATRGKAVYRLPQQNELERMGMTLDGSQFMRYTSAYYEGGDDFGAAGVVRPGCRNAA